MAKKKAKKAKKAEQRPKSVIEVVDSIDIPRVVPPEEIEEAVKEATVIAKKLAKEGNVPFVETAKPEIEQCPNCKRMVKANRIFRCPKCDKNGCDRCGWDALIIRNCPNCAVEIGA